jgi:hypothetical protein
METKTLAKKTGTEKIVVRPADDENSQIRKEILKGFEAYREEIARIRMDHGRNIRRSINVN